MWDIATRKDRPILCDYNIESLAFSPDGRTLALASANQAAFLWDMEEGRTRPTLPLHPKGHVAVALAPPGVLRHERAALRYAYPDEVRPFLERGQAVVLLQFLTRDGPHAVQVRDYLRRAAESQPAGAPAPFALWWRRGASVAFLVLPAQRSQAALLQRRVRNLLATPWGRLFTPPLEP
jgi:hypothetical protein